MKAFALSVLLAISSLFGFNKNQNISETTPTPTTIPTETIVVEETIVTPGPTFTPTITNKPTVAKPKSSINGVVLNKFFGITDKSRVDSILNNASELKRYEQEYYQKFLVSPILRITIPSEGQLVAMPSMNGVILCNSSQLKKLYDEISVVEKQDKFEKMDYDCHHNSKMQETAECQEWRRINDVNRVQPTKGSVDDEIANLQKKINDYANKKNIYDDLLVKYCQK